MSAPNPPHLASALMRWMGPRDEALVGDLVEAYRAGRSTQWYWRQVLAAIAIDAATTARAHKLLTVRAIVVGWLAVWLYVMYPGVSVLMAARALFGFKAFLFVTGITDYFWVHNIDLPAVIVRSGPDIVTAWVGMFASGWLVGRLHRAQGAALVLVYFATLPLPVVGIILWNSVSSGDFASGLALASLVPMLFAYAYFPALLGGLWAVRQRRRDSLPSSSF